MKYKILFLIFSMIFCQTVYAQQDYIKYYLLIDAAQDLKKKGAYKEAIQLYKKAFHAVETERGPDCLSIADCYLQLEKFGDADAYIRKAILSGVPMRYINRVKNGKDKTDRQKLFWKEIERNYNALRKQFYANIDIEKYLSLKIIKNADQEIRQHLMAKEDFNKNATLMAYAGVIDSVNIEKLLNVINEIDGWPGFISFGDAESGAYYVLLHLSAAAFRDSIRYNRIYTQFYNTAKQGVKDGELTPFQFAYWIDYHLKSTEGVQLYGVPSYKKWKKIPFKNVKDLEARRKEIGLPSLKIVYERAGEQLPEWYIESEKIKAEK